MTCKTHKIPLLRDRHNHPFFYAALLEGIDLGEDRVKTRDEAITRIRTHPNRESAGWLVVYGWNSGLYPLSKQDFDHLPPLVIFNLSLHDLIVNDAGRALLSRSDPVAVANLDNKNWIEQNLRRILGLFATPITSPERLQRFFQWLLEERGVYYAEEMLLLDEREIGLFEEAGLAERTRFWADPDLYDGLPRPIQDKVHGIKLFADGALGAWTAALYQPFQDTNQSAKLIHKQAALEDLLKRYLAFGKHIAVHAIGDCAIDQVVSAVEAVGRPAEREVRIEHAQFISESTAMRAKAMGIQLSMQPNFSDDSVHYDKRLPVGYAIRNNPFRMLIDQVGYVPGQDLLFGSDGMPHGVCGGLQQALFPCSRYHEQTLTLKEFVDGYCVPDGGPDCIEARIDPDNRQVTCRVVLRSGGGAAA